MLSGINVPNTKKKQNEIEKIRLEAARIAVGATKRISVKNLSKRNRMGTYGNLYVFVYFYA